MVGTTNRYIEQEKPGILSKLGDFIFGFFAGVVFFGAIILTWMQF